MDAVDALDAALHRAVMPASLSLSSTTPSTRARNCFACFAPRLDRSVHLLVSDRVDVAEGEVFEFAANLAHAEAVRDGCVDVERLARDLLLPLRRQMLERAHVMQTIGQFDEDDANVVHHGEHHFAQVFGLLLFLGGEVDFADLGDALDDVRDLLAEFLAMSTMVTEVSSTESCKQAGGNGDRVHLHVGEHERDFQRMHEIRLARGAGLPGMMLLRKFVCLFYELKIVIRTVLAQLSHQFAKASDREHVGRELLAQRLHSVRMQLDPRGADSCSARGARHRRESAGRPHRKPDQQQRNAVCRRL